MELTVVLPDTALAQAELLICNAITSPESRRAYSRAVREFIAWCHKRQESELSKAVVNRYRSYLLSQKLATSSINQKLSAIRRLATELGDNGILPAAVSAAISRVRGVRTRGVRL